MSVQSFAPVVTNCAASVTTTIESGENIRIYGFLVSGGAGTVTFANAAGTTLFTVVLDADATSAFSSEIPWLADAGLQVTCPAGITAVIFHGHGGA